MKHLMIALFCVCCCQLQAQRVSKLYNNVSLASALKELNTLQDRYIVNFIYDDLEDFKVSTQLSNLSVPDAVRRLTGFYPVRMTIKDNVILVECTHKTRRHLTGKVVDEHGDALPYANVLLLSVGDSSVIAGGVSNESGVFVVPYEPEKVLAKVSYVGYEPVCRLCTGEDVGTIRLKPSTLYLQTVKIRGRQQLYKMSKGGMTIDVEHSLLRQAGTANDVLKQLPRVNVGHDGAITVFAKGTPEVYVNDRLVRNQQELASLKSTEIKAVDVITSPGSRYNAEVQSVIRIKTKGTLGEGLSASATLSADNNSRMNTRDQLSLTYRTGGLEIFGNTTYNNSYTGEENKISSSITTTAHSLYTQEDANTDFRSSYTLSKLGFSYDFSPRHSLGASYSLFKSITGRGYSNPTQDVWRDGTHTAQVHQRLRLDVFNGPEHEANVYYLGQVGRLNINFNATCLWKKNGRNDDWQERSKELEDRDVHTYNTQRNKLAAAKLVLSHPLGQGTLEGGVELTRTTAHSTYRNPENYVGNTENDTRESRVAPFMDYSLTLGHWTFEAGLRHERVDTEYRLFGQREDEPSRSYSNWFPNASLSWNKNSWSAQLNYAKKIARPSYRDLRSNVQYINRFAYEAGNPYLQPVIRHNIELNVLCKWLNVSLGYSYRKHDIVYSSGLYRNQEIALIQNRNYPHTQLLYGSVVVSPKFGWYQPTLEVDLRKPFFPTKRYGSSRDLQEPSANLELNNKLVFSRHSFVTILLAYDTEACTDFIKAKSSGTVDLAYSHSFFNESLSLNVFVNDLLKTRRSTWTLYGQNVVDTKDCYEFTRSIGLILTWHFNATRSKYKGTGAGIDEKRRL